MSAVSVYDPTTGKAIGIASNPIAVLMAASSAASGGIAPTVSAALEKSHVLKASPGNLYSLSCTIGATSGWVLALDATSEPADGAVAPKWWMPINSNGTNGFVAADWRIPLVFQTGILVVFSTTGPFTKTASATAAFSAQVQ